jgi:hypothetical protein
MLINIVCPSCQVEGKVSLAQPRYEGPYKCWKCRELFSIRIEGKEVISCEPLTEEEFERQQAEAKIEAKKQAELDALKNRFRK